ncbi:MAG: hypothetical protein GX589_10415 [Deltaproteobacteria bacterium]|nr:hypothetical protein [Deltaproteobacteria bacterium]
MVKAIERSVCAVVFIGLLFGLVVSSVSAQSQTTAKKTAAKNEKKEKLPPSGLIAGTKTGEFGGTQIDGPWGGIHTSGSKADPISGSCSKKDSFTWTLKVFNNSKDKYNVNLAMLQFDVRNRQLKSDAFFSQIGPGQSIERVFPSHPDAAQCAVKLNNWKKIQRKKSAEELQQEIEKKKKELQGLESEVTSADS